MAECGTKSGGEFETLDREAGWSVAVLVARTAGRRVLRLPKYVFVVGSKISLNIFRPIYLLWHAGV